MAAHQTRGCNDFKLRPILVFRILTALLGCGRGGNGKLYHSCRCSSEECSLVLQVLLPTASCSCRCGWFYFCFYAILLALLSAQISLRTPAVVAAASCVHLLTSDGDLCRLPSGSDASRRCWRRRGPGRAYCSSSSRRRATGQRFSWLSASFTRCESRRCASPLAEKNHLGSRRV